MKIYKDFLSKKDFKKIESVIMGDYMPWYYNDNVIRTNQNSSQFIATNTSSALKKI